MFYATVFTFVVLFEFIAEAQFNQWDPFSPNFNPIPPETFQGGVFSPDWEANLARQIQESNARTPSEGSSSINTVNDVTMVTATIGGKLRMATLPKGSSVATSSNSYTNRAGQHVQEFTITVNGVPYRYTTVGNRTTGPAGGGPFDIRSR
uniref:Salivary secreted peptide n=1 Tax=Haemonchus contortus TaxID=6289 RepID=A0A7I5EES7_HAECO|nr:unnamed protein product [Haemonchus contortus]